MNTKVLSLLLLFVPGIIFSQTRTFYEKGYKVVHYNQISAFDIDIGDIWKDEAGQLWILNVGNLFCFDGYDFELYQPDEKTRMNDARDQFERVIIDQEGNIWLSSIQAGVVKYDAKSKTYQRKRIDKNQFVDFGSDHLAYDSLNNVFVGYTRGLLYFESGDSMNLKKIKLKSLAAEIYPLTKSIFSEKQILARHAEVGNNETLSTDFELIDDTELVIIGQGSLSPSKRFRYPSNVFLDYGWISNDKGDVVWQMSASKSYNAGSVVSNRLVIDFLNLPKGEYTVHYRTDDQYAFGDWAYYGNSSLPRFSPPSVPEHWGIDVYQTTAETNEEILKTITAYQSINQLNSAPADLFKDQTGRIWVYGHALQELKLKTDKSFEFKTLGHWDIKNGENNWNQIVNICDKDDDHLWMIIGGPDDANKERLQYGIFNKKTYQFIEVKTELPDAWFNVIQQDNDGNLWIGSRNSYGLYKLAPPFINYKDSGKPHLTKFHLTEGEDPVRRIKDFEIDDFNNLWIATQYDDLFKIDLDPIPYTYTNLSALPKLNNFDLTSVKEDAFGGLWITTDPFSLVQYDPSTQTINQYFTAFKDIPFEFIIFNTELPNGELLFQTEKGIILYNKNTDKANFKKVQGLNLMPIMRRRPASSKSFLYNDSLVYLPGFLINIHNWSVFKDLGQYISGKPYWQALKSKNNGLWLAQGWGEIARIDFLKEPPDTLEIYTSFTLHLSLLENEDSELYVANNSNLKTINGSNKTSRSFSANDGLIKASLYAQLLKHNENIWQFTDRGTSIINTKTKSITIPGQLANFSIIDAYKNSNGTFILLDEKGYYRFNPDSLKLDEIVPRVITKSLSYGEGDEKNIIYELNRDSSLQLRYFQNDILINYVGLQLKRPELTTYAYQLEGLSSEWQYVGNERKARFLNLSPGVYTFNVKAANADGIWSPITSSNFAISPPWWQTWWAYSIYALIAIGSLIRYNWALRRKIKQKQKKYEKEKAFSSKLEKLNTANARFVPKDFLQILGKESIEDLKLGDQSQTKMTILFSDIRSYTSLSETMSPDDNFKFINGYLGRVGPIIKRHNGFIDKYLGDGIMALFLNDHNGAVQAAIEIQKVLAKYNSERKIKDRIPIITGIGLNTGQLMLGVIGDENRYDSTVISDAVNIAARMEGLTKTFGASIIASERTLEEIDKTSVTTRYLGMVKVKGKVKALKIYDIIDGEMNVENSLKTKTLIDFERAIELYSRRNFGKAADLFKKVLEINNADKAARYYLDKSVGYILKGVEEDWKGIEDMAMK